MPTGTETIFIVHEVPKDRHGDPLLDSETVPDDQVDGCITWPRTSTEEGRGEVILEGLNVFLPPDSPLPGPKDQIRARAVLWDVDGAAGTYLKNGVEKGTLVALKKVGT
jgi:hypothetical protein